MCFVEVKDKGLRRIFDAALDSIHYAGACQRVGRCMRLAIIHKSAWVGGIVLGSTFPNIDVRDRFVGLKKYVVRSRTRGIEHPWSSGNQAYWKRLQQIVNHARTFVFPAFQGKGLGTRAHKLLLKEGISIWRRKYSDNVIALDTLCDHGDSRLFLENGWTLVGQTKGYQSNPRAPFATRSPETRGLRNNVGLIQKSNSRKWLVWVKLLR